MLLITLYFHTFMESCGWGTHLLCSQHFSLVVNYYVLQLYYRVCGISKPKPTTWHGIKAAVWSVSAATAGWVSSYIQGVYWWTLRRWGTSHRRWWLPAAGGPRWVVLRGTQMEHVTSAMTWITWRTEEHHSKEKARACISCLRFWMHGEMANMDTMRHRLPLMPRKTLFSKQASGSV